MEDKPLKVLSVCTSDTAGGAARAAFRIHKGVRELGVESQMFVKDKRSGDDSVKALGDFVPKGRLHRMADWVAAKVKNKQQHARWKKYPNRDNVFMSDMRGTRLYGAFQKQSYDVLHLHWINQRFAHVKDLPTDKPIVWTLHDSWPFCGVCHYFFDCEEYKHSCGNCPFLCSDCLDDLSHQVWKQKEKAYRHLDLHIVAPSQWLAQCARESSLFGRFPVTVIPNCLDADTFRPLTEEEISPRWASLAENRAGKRYVLFGAVNAVTDKIKGFVHLLDALRILSEQGHGEDFELIVFGADQPLEGMPESIPAHYVGYVSDTNELVSLYNLASVTVVPSLTENLSCTIMESLSCGTPVAAFNIGGNGDMIDHQENGYLARKDDNADLAAGILWCLENNQDGCLSKAGREKVLANYTPEVVARQYKELYLQCIDSRVHN